MKRIDLTVVKQNNVDTIKYDMNMTEVFDDRAAEKASQLNNLIIPLQYSEADGKRTITSYAHEDTNLSTLYKSTLTKKEVLCVMSGLASVFEIGAQGIPVSYIVKDSDYVYVDKTTYAVKCVLLPIKQDVMPMAEMPVFFREVISNIRYSEEDKDNYVAAMLTLINADDFTVGKLKDWIAEQLEKMGLFISKEGGLTDMSACGGATPQKNIKVNKIGVMANMQNSMNQQMMAQQPMMGQMGMAPQMPQQPMMGQPGMAPQMPQMPQQPMMGQPGIAPQAPKAPQMPQQPMMGQPGMTPQMPQQPMMGQPGMAPQMPQQPMMGQPGMAPQAPKPPVMPQAPAMGQPAMAPQPAAPQAPKPPVMPQAPAMGQPGMAPQPAAPKPPVMPQAPAMGQPGMAPQAPKPPVMPQAPAMGQPGMAPQPAAPQAPKPPVMPQAPAMGQPGMAPQAPKPPVMPQAPEAPAKTDTPVAPSPVEPKPVMPPMGQMMPSAAKPGDVIPSQMTQNGLVGQLGSKPIPHIVRKKTGEVINITKPEFAIGKSKTKADYAIEDNTAISRVHCIIVQKDGVNYIKDNNSTNHTYINGVELQPGKEVLLKNKTMIQLGDEEFTFLLRKGE